MSLQRASTVIVFMLVSTSAVTGHTCTKNSDLMKSIQYQLKLVEENDGTCSCDNKGNTGLSERIGFSARMSTDVGNRETNTVLIYDRVTTNVGGGYDVSSGIFTAPYGGLYFFSWTTVTSAGKSFGTDLVLNGNVEASNHAYARGLSENISATQNVVLNLKKGDKVNIKLHNTGQYLFSAWSMYSGFII